MHSDSIVSFSVKDLFDKVDRRFDKQDVLLEAISLRMDGMATKDDINEVRAEVGDLRGRVATMEDAQKVEHVKGDVRASIKSRIGWVVAFIAVPVGVALILVLVHK